MRARLFLYLALACFLALVAIFVVDGFLGLYDSLYLTVGERQEVIEPDYWLQPRPSFPGDGVDYYLSAEWGQNVFFRYQIDNRRFTSYPTTVRASLWQESQELSVLFSEEKAIRPFDSAVAEWTLSTGTLEPPAAGTSGQYTVRLGYGEVERRIVVDFYYPGEPKPVPTR